MTRNHASGGGGVRVARSHPRRQSAAETRAIPLPDRSSRIAVVDITAAPGYPIICVQAATQFWIGSQSVLPLSQVASGVFQKSSDWKYDAGALAWSPSP